MLSFLFFSLFFFCTILGSLFFLISKKNKWDNLNSSSFECGFSSWFFSRFSFSIHYFLVALIFLFLDLELCLVLPLLNFSNNSMEQVDSLSIFVLILLLGLLLEWAEKKLDWLY